ncbi:MAG: Co2+/Mg2+ efflux protein ApaG [Sphingomonadaceae bacterium]
MQRLFQHAAITHGVAVFVTVNFLPEQSSPEKRRWFWVYHIRIENRSEEDLQLISRHWRITDANGDISHVDGEGVVGKQPLLLPGDSHDYVSGCPLSTPYGAMEGHYRFEDADGKPRDIAIPFFPLSTGVVTG